MRHIVALRGDPPEPGKPFAPHPDGYANAAELVAGLKKVAPFEISVAAYPECHPDSADRGRPTSTISSARSTPAPTGRSPSSSSRRLLLQFRDEVAAAGIDAEIMPGILPVSNVAQTRKFAAMCGAAIPPGWTGCSRGWTICPPPASSSPRPSPPSCARQLYAGGVRQFHFYTLNRAELSYAICHLLGLRPKDKASEHRRTA